MGWRLLVLWRVWIILGLVLLVHIHALLRIWRVQCMLDIQLGGGHTCLCWYVIIVEFILNSVFVDEFLLVDHERYMNLRLSIFVMRWKSLMLMPRNLTSGVDMTLLNSTLAVVTLEFGVNISLSYLMWSPPTVIRTRYWTPSSWIWWIQPLNSSKRISGSICIRKRWP